MATTQAAGTERMNSDMTPSTPAMTDMPRRWPHGILGAIGRGLRGKCPACGEGRLFRAYLKVADNCPACGEELHHHRADDFPAYLVIIITGHILVPIVLAVETNSPLPVVDPGADCKKVTFSGAGMRGIVETVDTPKIDGTQTIGVHRILQATINNQQRTGETYNYAAHFGVYQVIVAANPLVEPDKPVVPVNTQRARDLLVAGVNAIRS